MDTLPKLIASVAALVAALALAWIAKDGLFRSSTQPFRSSTQPRYQLYGIDEISPFDGKPVKSVYRLDTTSGRTWRLEANAVTTGKQDAQGKPFVDFADGWEEMPESPEAALAKGRAKWAK